MRGKRVSEDPIVRVVGRAVQVTPKTQWVFLEIQTKSGLSGVGEASLNNRETQVLARAETIAGELIGRSEPALPAPNSLVDAAGVSALDQALWDIKGRRDGRRVADLLGGTRRTSIPVYANINRRTLDRSPEGFASSARDALAAGFSAFKIAPFDEAMPGENKADSVTPGLARIAAVRAAVGQDRALMVDCHWRLNEALAETVIRAAIEQSLYWVECPLPETEEMLPALHRLRGLANAGGVRLAGCEQGVRQAGFEPFLKAGAYDAMMPDVKYVGGVAEVMRLAETFDRHGVLFSPHNPTGPVCHATSLQVCAAVPHLDRLEMQFDETPLFAALAGGALPVPAGGASALPSGAGLGVTLAPDVVATHEVGRFIRE